MERNNSPADRLLDTGLKIAGYTGEQIAKVCNETNLERFRTFYGTSPQPASMLWEDLKTVDTGEAKIEKLDVMYFLMTIYWMRTYQTLRAIATVFKIHRETVAIWVWKYVEAIKSLRHLKVRFFVFVSIFPTRFSLLTISSRLCHHGMKITTSLEMKSF
jgi:hypothetical protein